MFLDGHQLDQPLLDSLLQSELPIISADVN
jgi:hypothetical protein